MSLGKNIRAARHARRMSQAALASELGVSTQAISQWENDHTAPESLRLQALSRILGVSLSKGEFATGEGKEFAPGRYIPLISRVQAGVWHPALSLDVIGDLVNIQWSPRGPTFALEIEGESMLPDFRPKDIIIIDTGLPPLPGDFVVASLDNGNEATFKKYRPRGEDEEGSPIIELAPLNPDYPTLVISSKNPGRIVGTMFEHRRFRQRA